MKKTVTVNLNGRVFTMDEDAYQLLGKYLDNLRIYFRREEGASEIIADFEARIEELFSERIRLGYEVITVEQVEDVIARVGKPADFGNGEPENHAREEENRKDKQQSFGESCREGYRQVKKTFFRDSDAKMLGGICSGLAARFGWEVSMVRIIAIVLMFASSFTVVPVYLLAWIIFPAAKTVAEKLQMQGKPVTVENIGKTVAAEAEPVKKHKKRGRMEGFLEGVAALMKICLIGTGCLIGLPFLFALMMILVMLFAVLFGAADGWQAAIPFGFTGEDSLLRFEHPLLASVAFLFVIGIPLAALIYRIVAGIAGLTPVNKLVKRIILIVWLLALVLFFSSGIGINKDHGFFGWQPDVANNIRKSDRYAEREYVIDQPFASIDLADDLICTTQITQTAEGPATIKISGEASLLKYIRHEVNNGRLHLSNPERKQWLFGKRFTAGFEQINIHINTLGVKEIESDAEGRVWITNVFKVDSLKLEVDGAGKFRADNLDVQFLEATCDGVGEILLGGKARKARFEMEGTGRINALKLVADSVEAQVEGVGSVKCNPARYLKGKVNGIGSLTYRKEPQEKHTEVLGIGRIGKER